MNITFINKSRSNKIRLNFEEVDYCLEPQRSLDIPFMAERAVFTAETVPLDYEDEFKSSDFGAETFKEKLLEKATKKFFQKLPELTLYTAVTYAFECNSQNVTIELDDSVYSSCDGDVADFFDMMPVVYLFAKAESADTKIKAIKAKNTNRRRFIKLFRKVLLFLNWGMLFLNLFEFIPNYAVLKFYATDFYVTWLLKKLYALSINEREYLIAKKAGEVENKPQNKWKRHLWGFIKVLIVLFALLGICLWATSGEPEAVYY